jgi:hypothetical protein
VLLARAFLPGMLARRQGVFACVSSSGAAPYMGPYEVFKTAQVELANTLDAELEGTGISVFTIGPGLVRTPGAEATIPQIAPLYGKTVAEFYAMSEKQVIQVEAAGAGFAAACALAERFRGQEIGSAQALVAAGIEWRAEGGRAVSRALTGEERAEALALCREVRQTLAEQAQGWAERPLFERQWVVRDFKKTAGLPVEEWRGRLDRLETCLESGDREALDALQVPAGQLAGYYEHLQDLAKGYEKDPEALREHLAIVQGWEAAAGRLGKLLDGRKEGRSTSDA